MNVKIDTKEKFTVITPIEHDIPANMTGEMEELLLRYLNKGVPHLILNMQNIESLDQVSWEKIVNIQKKFYERNCSFVICEVNKEIEAQLLEMGEDDNLNIIPTESEAWDIVQMEEVERELMREFDNDEPV